MELPNGSYAGILAFALVDALLETMVANGQRDILAKARATLVAARYAEADKAAAYIDRRITPLNDQVP